MPSRSKTIPRHNASNNVFKSITPTIAIVTLILALSVVYLATSSIPKYSNGGTWTSFILNNNDSRFQINSTINASNVGSLKQTWFFNTQNDVTSTPVVSAGTVYFADWGGNVYAVNVLTGTKIWEANLNNAIKPGTKTAISSTLTLAYGNVYVSDGLGNVSSPKTYLFALSQSDGSIVWKDTGSTFKTTMTSMWGSPTIYNNVIYIGVSGTPGPTLDNSPFKIGAIYAINAQNGAKIWNYTTMIGNEGGAGVWGTPVIDPSLNAIYFGTGSTASFNGTSSKYAYTIFSLNATNGKKNWLFEAYNSSATGRDFDFGSTANLFSVRINNAVYTAVGLGNKYGNYFILDRENGTLLKTYKVGYGGDGIVGAAGFYYSVPNAPKLIIPSYYEANNSVSGAVTALAPSTNKIVWRFYTPGPVVGSVTLIPGAILFGDDKGNVYAINSTSGSQIFYSKFPGTQINAGVTVAEGYAFIPTSFGPTNEMGVYGYTIS